MEFLAGSLLRLRSSSRRSNPLLCRALREEEEVDTMPSPVTSHVHVPEAARHTDPYIIEDIDTLKVMLAGLYKGQRLGGSMGSVRASDTSSEGKQTQTMAATTTTHSGSNSSSYFTCYDSRSILEFYASVSIAQYRQVISVYHGRAKTCLQ